MIIIFGHIYRPSALSVVGYKSGITSTTVRCDGCGKVIEKALYINGKRFCTSECYTMTAYSLNGWGL